MLQLRMVQGDLEQAKILQGKPSSALENEKKQLEERVQQLEFSLAEMEVNANVTESMGAGQGDKILTKLTEEKKAADGQVRRIGVYAVAKKRSHIWNSHISVQKI